jgi:hypothetical protein
MQHDGGYRSCLPDALAPPPMCCQRWGVALARRPCRRPPDRMSGNVRAEDAQLLTQQSRSGLAFMVRARSTRSATILSVSMREMGMSRLVSAKIHPTSLHCWYRRCHGAPWQLKPAACEHFFEKGLAGGDIGSGWHLVALAGITPAMRQLLGQVARQPDGRTAIFSFLSIPIMLPLARARSRLPRFRRRLPVHPFHGFFNTALAASGVSLSSPSQVDHASSSRIAGMRGRAPWI